MEINNAQSDTALQNTPPRADTSQLATMISLVIKNVKSAQPVEQRQIPGLETENTLIFQTMDGSGITVAEVIKAVVEASPITTDVDTEELTREIAEKIIQSTRSNKLSLEEIFPALFGQQSDSYSTQVLIDYLDPATIPIAGFETRYILSSPYDKPESEIRHNTDTQIIFPANQANPNSGSSGTNNGGTGSPEPEGNLTANDDSFSFNEDTTLSNSVASNDSTTSGGTLNFALDTDVSNGNLIFNNDGSFDYTPDSNFNGSDSFSYTVTDSDSGETSTNTVSLTISATTDLTATDDSFTTNEDTALSDTVATNDSTTSG